MSAAGPPVPLHRAVAEVTPRDRWVGITYIEAALRAQGRTASRDDLHLATLMAERRHLIARRRRRNRTYHFRRQPFSGPGATA